jgi:hypothetical protein
MSHLTLGFGDNVPQVHDPCAARERVPEAGVHLSAIVDGDAEREGEPPPLRRPATTSAGSTARHVVSRVGKETIRRVCSSRSSRTASMPRENICGNSSREVTAQV